MSFLRWILRVVLPGLGDKVAASYAFFRYGDFHYNDKMVVRPLNRLIFITGILLYWGNPQVPYAHAITDQNWVGTELMLPVSAQIQVHILTHGCIFYGQLFQAPKCYNLNRKYQKFLFEPIHAVTILAKGERVLLMGAVQNIQRGIKVHHNGNRDSCHKGECTVKRVSDPWNNVLLVQPLWNYVRLRRGHLADMNQGMSEWLVL